MIHEYVHDRLIDDRTQLPDQKPAKENASIWANINNMVYNKTHAWLAARSSADLMRNHCYLNH